MPFNTGVRDALSGANLNANALRDAIEAQHAWVLPTANAATDFTPGLTRVIIASQTMFHRDDADATTPHDGVTCIVAQGGVRFKADGIPTGVLSRTFPVVARLNTPPGSPALGKSWLVLVGTGAWSTKNNQIATWTARGWRFSVAKAYDLCAVEVENLYYHFTAAGAWASGIPSSTLALGSVTYQSLKNGLGFAVENTTTNTPPVSPTIGLNYIVGPAPLGLWTGHTGKIAEWNGVSWSFTMPAVGWSLYDKARNQTLVYGTAGWSGGASVMVGRASVSSDAYINTAYTQAQGAGYQDGVAPVTTSAFLSDTLTITYQAKKVGAKLKFTVQARLAITRGASGTSGAFVHSVGLIRDSEIAAVDWARPIAGLYVNNANGNFSDTTNSFHFEIESLDTASHDYRIGMFLTKTPNSNFSDAAGSFGRRLIIVEEYS